MESATNTGELAQPIPRAARAPGGPRARGAARLPGADQAADHRPAPGHHRGDDVRRRPLRARRWRRSSGRCSAATWPPAAPGRSTTTWSATATRAWRGPAAAPWSRGGSSRATGSSSGSRSARWRSLELALAVNALAAALALAGLLGYVFVYTLWLKPLTPQNIVIGGAAGAVPPLVGWAAATGGLTLDALYPFAIVFLWTPPHFWALALLVKDDYARSRHPDAAGRPRRGGDAPPDPRLQRGAGGVHGAAVPHRPVRSALPRGGAGARRRLRRPRGPPRPAPLAGGRGPPSPGLARLPGAPVLCDGR